MIKGDRQSFIRALFPSRDSSYLQLLSAVIEDRHTAVSIIVREDVMQRGRIGSPRVSRTRVVLQSRRMGGGRSSSHDVNRQASFPSTPVSKTGVLVGILRRYAADLERSLLQKMGRGSASLEQRDSLI